MKMSLLGCLAMLLLEQPETYNLQVEIQGIQELKGTIRLAVYTEDQEFLRETILMSRETPVNQATQEISVNLPFGKYAIAVYQDLDENGELNSNWIGIPKEPYGFSNNAMGTFGPPDFNDAAFEFDQSGKKIQIKLRS